MPIGIVARGKKDFTGEALGGRLYLGTWKGKGGFLNVWQIDAVSRDTKS